MVPLVLPPTVLGFYLLVTFGARSPLGQAFQNLFQQSLPFSFEGLLLASAIANIPFVVQPIQRSFEAIPTDVREAAACCGLTPWQRFRRIEVPLAWPGILTAAMLAFAHTLVAPPGTRWNYANNDTLALSYLLRVRLDDDEAYLRFPHEKLFLRIGMRDTTPETDWDGTFILSSQVWTTARDLARFGQLLLDDGTWNGERILPEGWVAFMRTPAPAQPPPRPDGSSGSGYGAQVWLPGETGADTTWLIEVRAGGDGRIITAESRTISEPSMITDLWGALPRPLLGAYEISVRGPLGRGAKRTVFVAEGLKVDFTPRVRVFDASGLARGQAEVSAAIGARAHPARLSFSPPFSPRATQARKACSRRSRRGEDSRKGTTRLRERVMRWPSRPRSAAAAAAAATRSSGRPARSSGPRGRVQACSSASTFWPKAVPRLARRSSTSFSRARSGPASLAPARTNMRW